MSYSYAAPSCYDAADKYGYSYSDYGSRAGQAQLHRPAPAAEYGYAKPAAEYGYSKPGAEYSCPAPDPFAVMHSAFPQGTDPKVVEAFNRIDRDRNGVIDDRELQGVLASLSRINFSLRTVHLLMYTFTNSNARKIGPKEFAALYKSLQTWRGLYQRYDKDRNGRIDAFELREALTCVSGTSIPPVVLDVLLSKFGKAGSKCSLEYDNFIECCMTIKGLTQKFKAKDDFCGNATFTYQEFLMSVLPFVVA